MEKKERIINALVAGHSQAGKSSLISTIVGKFPDTLDYELNHGTTVSLKVIQFLLKEKNILLNFLDSPGHADFKGSIALGLEFADLLILVISGNEGFQARTYWLYEKALQYDIPIVIAATKMDLQTANTETIKKELKKLGAREYPIIKTSSKEKYGIKELIGKISLYIQHRDKEEKDLSFIILGYSQRKGIGDLINIGIFTGKLESNTYISDTIRVRQLFSIKGNPVKIAHQGQIIQLSLNIESKFELGTKYYRGKFISPRIKSLLSEIKPRKEFHIQIEDPIKFKIATDLLEQLKRIVPSFDYYKEQSDINIQVLGDVQFDFIKENLEKLIEFKVVGSKVKGIITINKKSKARFNSARVRIAPQFKEKLNITRNGSSQKSMHDILGATAAYEAFHLDGLLVDIQSGSSEDDIAQAIAKAIEKVKLIKVIPHQDIIVKVENYNDIYSLVEKYDIEILYQSQSNVFFLQVKNAQFELFFNSLMKISDGRADINLFNFEQGERILSVDPGTRHFGFCLIERSELPSLWYVNLKDKINGSKSKLRAKERLEEEIDLFLGKERQFISRIFIGNGPGAKFIIDFFIEYFDIPCENRDCVITNFDDISTETLGDTPRLSDKSFKPPDIFLVDEFKTTKEALYHLKRGELVSEVKSKGFVDHAIAALLIAKRGIKGEIIEIEKKPLKQLYDYVVENYAGSYSFSSIHNVNNLADLRSGMHLRIKDSSKLDSNTQKGDIIIFNGFGRSYKTLHATTLLGNKIIIKFLANVSVRKDFFKIFVPVRER
ncbi:MAG: GTP-binding protein [Candidatus Lokiarchaeota archaeon]|nr:GTP-binding protein [Candidatus Lokiarchaeota archaeon]MBD3201934.1 GTP-binding protein [Candidatus Lokiarchaeota archaeon]